MDEKVLISKVKSGDTESFRYLYRLHAESAWRLALSVCRHRTNAEEAVQNSFIAAFRYIHTFQGESTFKTWLLRIVLNESVRIQKKEKNYRWEPLDHMDDDAEPLQVHAAATLQQKELKEQITKILALLNDKERIVLHLFYMEELSVKELAGLLGFTEANVKILLHRARKSFKQHFEIGNFTL